MPSRIPRLSCFVLLCAFSPRALAADSPAPEGVLTRPPAVLESIQPEYPEAARAAGLQAEVALEIDISEKGEVLDARVLQPVGNGFDEAALTAARALRFQPAEIDGRPAAVRIEYRFNFEMKEAPPAPPASAEPGGPAPAPATSLRGVILQRGSKRPLPAATIDLGDGAQVVYSDAEGRFAAEGLPEGRVKVIVVANDHERFETSEVLHVGIRTEVKYYLRRSRQGEFESVVVGERERKEVTTVALSAGEVRRIPGVSGDTVKVVQNLPGVARTSFGSGALVVRGGNVRDTRVYVDGLEVPLIFHFGGITSIYSAELSDQVDFEPGNFGARYGRATAGRLELKTRDPESRQHRAVFDANLFHATAFLEVPVRENLSFALAGRRSYVDGLLGLVKDSLPVQFDVAPRYYDFQGKLTWKISPRDTLRLSLFGADDAIETLAPEEDDELRPMPRIEQSVRFATLAATWDHRFDSATRFHVLLAEQYVGSRTMLEDLFEQTVSSWITSVRAEGTHDLTERLSLSAGLDLQLAPSLRVDLTTLPPPRADELMRYDDPPIRVRQRFRTTDLGFWLEGVWKPLEGLSLVPGLRLDYDHTSQSTTWFDPRFAARWQIVEGTTLKGGVGLYHQPPSPGLTLAEWGNPELAEEGALQYGLGVEQRLWGPLSVDAQLYYKRLFDLATPSSRVVTRDGRDERENYANEGKGKAYGAEVLLRYNPDGRFFGWLAYSYARTKRENTKLDPMNEDGADYDQPHNLTAVGSLELPEVWDGLSCGFRLRYGSGNPYRRVTGAVFNADEDIFEQIPSRDRGARMPDFFQLDLRVDKRWTFDTWAFSAYLDLQNVTNRRNADSVSYSHDYSELGYSSSALFYPSFGLRAEY